MHGYLCWRVKIKPICSWLVSIPYGCKHCSISRGGRNCLYDGKSMHKAAYFRDQMIAIKYKQGQMECFVGYISYETNSWLYKYQLLRNVLLAPDRGYKLTLSNHLQVNDLGALQEVCHLRAREKVSGNSDKHCLKCCHILSVVGGMHPDGMQKLFARPLCDVTSIISVMTLSILNWYTV